MSGGLDAAFILGLAPAAWYRYGQGITVVGAGVDTWADQSGNGRDLRQTTDTNRPAKNADGSITGDGVDNFMAAAFTRAHPRSVYALVRIDTWTLNDALFDGATTDTMEVYMTNTSPKISLHAGAAAAENSDMVIGQFGVVSAIFNGVSSSLRVNLGTRTTGNPGNATSAGITLWRPGAFNGNYAHATFKEFIDFSGAHDVATQDRVARYLMQVGGVA